MKKHLLGIAALGLVLFGCGDDVTKTTVVEESGILQLAKGEELPECDSSAMGEMLYAADSVALYICDETGWLTLNGKDTTVVKDTLVVRDTLFGLNGESCTAEMLKDSRGYKIVCGGDSVGVVLNGINGEKGDDGENCTVADSGNGVVLVQCESDTIALYKALCGTTPFDPLKSLCKGEKLYSCNDKPYDPSESFCGKTLASKDTVLFYDTLSTTYLNQTKLASGDYGYLLDTRDGQVYRTTTIGTQTWMAQNLNYTYNEGSAHSYCLNNNANYCTKYGSLYTWSAAMDSAAVFSENGESCGYGVTCSATEPVRGVCPKGWHLPTLAEFETLITYVGGESSAGKMLKATRSWNNNDNGTDDYGFSAFPLGYRNSDGNFLSASSYAFFWSATESDADYARSMYLYSDNDDAVLYGQLKDYARSVRCVKD